MYNSGGSAALVNALDQQHYACMATITIRDLTEEARTELAARAARRGQSMQQFVRLLLEAEASSPDLNDLVGRIARRKETTASSVSAERILEAKDADRR